MAQITGIEYYLPAATSTATDLAREFPEWSAEQIAGKTGIRERHIAAPDECASDLVTAAAEALFSSGAARPAEIDYILFCTQSPDYFLPTTACLLQNRLNVPATAGALDFNLGCSGFVYGLGLARGLIDTGQAKCVLLLTGETYTKFIHPADKSVRTIFGDAGAAIVVRSGGSEWGPFVYGTDGAGAQNLIVPTGGTREPRSAEPAPPAADAFGNLRSRSHLFMNGPEIFNFTLNRIPATLVELLDRAGRKKEDIDLFVFHQANRYMLDHLRRKMGIPAEKFMLAMESCGNTVSCTIPIALKAAVQEGRLKAGDCVALVGFGVGYSWGATLLRWSDEFRN
jgi:3-oxoacyl-[acyl-carrier-protein] synthase III